MHIHTHKCVDGGMGRWKLAELDMFVRIGRRDLYKYSGKEKAALTESSLKKAKLLHNTWPPHCCLLLQSFQLVSLETLRKLISIRMKNERLYLVNDRQALLTALYWNKVGSNRFKSAISV